MNPVMCVTKDTLNLTEGINKIQPSDFEYHFIQRSIVDSKLPKYHAIGTTLLQLLPYIVVKCGNEYLTYARKGTEARLHGKRSIGFGGHIDLSDFDDIVQWTIHNAGERELKEELDLEESLVMSDEFIFTNYDNVSQVHLGCIGYVEIKDKSLVKPNPDEILDPQWLTAESIRAKLDTYEKWSRILIKHLDKLGE